ncbi:M20/M25/M40 family metallo-hydrolase [Streptacidiphilus monticola]
MSSASEQLPPWTRVVGPRLMARARADLARLVAMPTVVDGGGPASAAACRTAAAWVASAFAACGVGGCRPLDVGAAAPAVVGHRPPPPGAPTVLLYSHYDVQPPGDLAEWHSPPFRLTERGGRWYGRGAADAKGNLVAHLTALRALGPDPPVGVRVLVEGSEESDSSALVDHVRAHPATSRRTRSCSATPATPRSASPPPPWCCAVPSI